MHIEKHYFKGVNEVILGKYDNTSYNDDLEFEARFGKLRKNSRIGQSLFSHKDTELVSLNTEYNS